MNDGTKDLIKNQLQMLTMVTLSYSLYGADGYFKLVEKNKEVEKKIKEEAKKIGKNQAEINNTTEKLSILAQFLRIKLLKDNEKKILIKELNNIANELNELIKQEV